MSLGGILGSISPLFGMASGKGLFGKYGGDILGTISPAYGMMSGNGLFGGMGGQSAPIQKPPAATGEAMSLLDLLPYLTNGQGNMLGRLGQ